MLRAEVGNLLQKGEQVLVHFVCSSIPSIGCSSVPMQLVDPKAFYLWLTALQVVKSTDIFEAKQ